MPERPKIRWTPAQLRQLRRNVSAYNAARTRAIKGDPGIVDFLPPKLNMKEEKARIKSRQDLKLQTLDVNRELKYKFQVVDLDNGEKRLRSELENVRGLVERANRIKKQVAKERGVEQPRPGRSGSFQQQDLAPFRTDLENISGKDWERFVAMAAARADKSYYTWEAEQYKEYYIEQIWKAMGAQEETLELVEFIQTIPAEVMIRANRLNTKLTIEFLYDWKEEDLNDLRTALWEEWANYGKPKVRSGS